MQNLFVRQTDGQYAPASRKAILNAAREVATLRPGTMLNSPKVTRDFLTLTMRPLEHEVFAMIVLDNRHRVVEYVELFRGTIDGASVHPREVVKEVLQRNGAAVIFAHNHPSGVAEASQADELITRRLRDALAMIDVRTLDHIIVGDTSCLSFAERGMI